MGEGILGTTSESLYCVFNALFVGYCGLRALSFSWTQELFTFSVNRKAAGGLEVSPTLG
jgi:hypothetical protein